MTALPVALIVLAAVAAFVDWWAVTTRRTRLEYACKPLTIVLLIGVAAAIDHAIGSRRGWFIAALVLCLAGDVLLMLPQDLFVPGLASFLGGHLCYIVGLTRHGDSAGAVAVAAVAVAAAGVLPATRILPAVRRADRAMVVPVSAYMTVISAMVATALASGSVLAAAGAALFYLSDASIAWDRFVRSWTWARTWIMVTYHLAQALLVLSLAR